MMMVAAKKIALVTSLEAWKIRIDRPVRPCGAGRDESTVEPWLA